ncbi:probable phytol kinase 3, chloroplastic [Hibiscus syriacus]|uniref:probable phytol kinase 3, chloroplastic n=1 Tax=Hibiscus syriacus TaxID=106335 RepID=UPI0019237B90|nr:probable phytol kinase 3, chloroplastic [Hibiscus syriacus]
MLSENSVVADLFAALVCCVVIFAFLLLWKETAKRGEDQFSCFAGHYSGSLISNAHYIVCHVLPCRIANTYHYTPGFRGATLAAITPGVNIIRMLLIGSGIWKDEGTVKSMSRYGDYRELLKGPLYYAITVTLACAVYWRNSPIGIAAICNLCAADGFADTVGRRFGRQKLPYNRNKSIAGSVAMATAGFLSSVGYMYYFSYFGYIQKSWGMVLGFLIVPLASALVESLPISTELDDNLTVTLTSIFISSLIF